MLKKINEFVQKLGLIFDALQGDINKSIDL